jgi:hypothetical protein
MPDSTDPTHGRRLADRRRAEAVAGETEKPRRGTVDP